MERKGVKKKGREREREITKKDTKCENWEKLYLNYKYLIEVIFLIIYVLCGCAGCVGNFEDTINIE